jgi:small subunit ribosomal protein S2
MNNNIPTVEIKELLEAGVHLGHKITRWNPKMEPYLYGIRNKSHIINLEYTKILMTNALNAMYDIAKKNGKILFVSTKDQASEILARHVEKCGQYYVNHRWLGGMLTNWGTISKSIKKLESLEKTLIDEEQNSMYTKKELLDISRKKDKLLRSLGGIRHLKGKPDLVVIIGTIEEKLAIAEALKLQVPIAAIVDSNSNPDNIDYLIPGNDDAMSAIELYCRLFSDAVLAGMEESLISSGVDLGEMKDTKAHRDKDDRKMTRMNSSKKFSKVPHKQPEKPMEEATEIKLEN